MYNDQRKTGVTEIQVSALQCWKTVAFGYYKAFFSQCAFKFQNKTFPKARLITSDVL